MSCSGIHAEQLVGESKTNEEEAEGKREKKEELDGFPSIAFPFGFGAHVAAHARGGLRQILVPVTFGDLATFTSVRLPRNKQRFNSEILPLLCPFVSL